MDSTLSELPFFSLLFLPEEFTLSQLPFFSEESVQNSCLPPPPIFVCDECWEGPFAMRLGLPFLSPRDGQWHQRWPKEHTYVTTPTRLKSRANAGCVWCRFIFDSKDAHWTIYFPDEPVTITVRGVRCNHEDWFGWPQDCQELQVKINGYDVDSSSRWPIIYAAPDDPAASYITARSPVLDVGSLHALALAKQRISECADNHQRCKSTVPLIPRLPTRLVDCSDPREPRLVSTTGEYGEYLALSYVWGEDQVHKTTMANISMYEGGISPSILPPTIYHAIYVTYTLGYRWIWVDSLCIIQDSDEDMAHEIGCMQNIYRYAHLTIVTGSAAGVKSGFLWSRQHSYKDIALPFICPPRPPNSVEGFHDDHPPVTQALRAGQVHLTWPLRRTYSEELGWTGTRAWCMQEYLMSPRALIFTPTTLRFKCLVGVQDICNSYCSACGTNPQIPDILFLRDPPIAEPGSKEWKDMHEAWMVVVEDYTRRTASVESDKLVACAALAELFHGVLDSEYLAGLWRSDTLLAQLLWGVDKYETGSAGFRRSRRPTAYRAPSWSWAATNGVVNHHWHPLRIPKLENSDETVVLAEVVECRVTLEDPALRFGRVTDGILVLHGALIPCRRNPKAYSDFGRKDHDACFAGSTPSFEQAQGLQWGFGGLSSGAEEDRAIDLAVLDCLANVFMDCGVEVDELPERMWIVPFVRGAAQDNGDQFHRVHGIVLKLAPSSNSSGSQHQNARFQRIGFFYSLVRREQEHRLWDPLSRAVKDGELTRTDIVIV